MTRSAKSKMDRRERNILTEFIELYCNLPCLWDVGSDLYKDKNQKIEAWHILARKLKELDPEANVALAKKKIEHMRTARRREAKKIKESQTTGTGTGDVHVPNLWYYNLLSPVFDKTDELFGSGVDTLKRDRVSQTFVGTQTGKCRKAMRRYERGRGLEHTKLKLMETAQALLQTEDKKPNYFGVYVGEQLEQVTTFQRHVAEKLISDVLFLAKTGNLSLDSKIETPSKSRDLFSSSNSAPYSESPSPHYILPSPPLKCLSSPPSPQFSHKSSSSSQIIEQTSTQECVHNKNEGPANSLLKELLIDKRTN